MRVKLLKSVIVNAVSNTEATRAGSVVEVDDAEGRDLVSAGYAEETTHKVTAEARRAPEPENKMAPDGSNKEAREAGRSPTPIEPPAKTPAAKTVGTVPRGKR